MSNTSSNWSWWLTLFGVASAVKLLLLPAYHSTDFDVHRNWLAITYQLPVACWYFDETSQWTLDYPPLFAWFEAGLARLFAALLALSGNAAELRMLALQAAPYASAATVLLQRLSVMATDALLLLGTRQLAICVSSDSLRTQLLLGSLVLLNAGLLLVDHVHFQYNGWLLGLLLLACAWTAQRRFLAAAVAFAALVCAKHLFVTLGPLLVVVFVAGYVLGEPSASAATPFASLRRLGALACAVLLPTVALFLPFVLLRDASCGAATPADALRQIVARLFPFGARGLLHAYWAPNAWALYGAAELVLSRALSQRVGGALTSGRVELAAQEMRALPLVQPWHCAALSLLAMLPVLWRAARRRVSAHELARALAHASLCVFCFGWHVHEKAVLVSLVPLAFTAVRSRVAARRYCALAAAAGCSLVPLLAPASVQTRVVGYALVAAQWLLARRALACHHRADPTPSRWDRAVDLYALLSLAALPLFVEVVQPHVLARYEFIPLLLTSLTGALGVLAVWAALYWRAE